MIDSINIISTKELSKEEFYSTELQARQHVPFNTSWVAFEIPKDTIEKYYVACITIKIPNSETTQNVYGYLIATETEKYLIAIKGVSYNELYYLYTNMSSKDANFVVPETSVLGSFEKLYRRKYISTPAVSYWNQEQVPVIITK